MPRGRPPRAPAPAGRLALSPSPPSRPGGASASWGPGPPAGGLRDAGCGSARRAGSAYKAPARPPPPPAPPRRALPAAVTSRPRPGARRGAGGARTAPQPSPGWPPPRARGRPSRRGTTSARLPATLPEPRHPQPRPGRVAPLPTTGGVPGPPWRTESLSLGPPRPPHAGGGPESQVPTHLRLGQQPRSLKPGTQVGESAGGRGGQNGAPP